MIRCMIGTSGTLTVFICTLFFITAAFADDRCSNPIGRLVSVQGDAQFREKNQTNWLPVEMDRTFCAGDVLKIGMGGRAAVVLENESILRIDQNSTLNFGDSEKGFSLLNLIQGVLHIFSHRPRSLEVKTPYVNGMVEGTEFLVTTDDRQSFISVFEGLVNASNQFGTLEVGSGQAVTVAKGKAPVYEAVVSPRDAVTWTLYYPVILSSTPGSSGSDEASQLVQASDYLSVGRVEEAESILAPLGDNGDALALRSIIEVVQNKNVQALELAERAIDAAPDSAAAGLSLSYARQALFDLDGALEILTNTARVNPENGYVQARLAELQMSAGYFSDALDSAMEAERLSPGNARAQAVLGFAYLATVEIDSAMAAFTQAVMLDQAMPLARLGWGLAKIRHGDLAGGRSEIEIAAALDPGSSLIRSYLGKAYFEEKRGRLAARQYEVAKDLDGADPTPWFYDAILKQTENRPAEALKSIQKSIALNDNRAVYRSRLMLDDDLASRSASLGRIYQDLGFEQLALAEGWKSVASQPGNFSAHRFLSDSYSKLPRHEIARVSELLQSQLLQPLNINPVQPQLAESDLAILEGSGPSQAAYNEYNQLFLRNRYALQANGVAGSNGTFGDELVHSAVVNKFSYSIGQFYYESDGIRENNDQQKKIYNVYLQGMVSPRTSWMFETRYRDDDTGDMTFNFDPEIYRSTLRQYAEDKSARAGFRHDFNPGSTLLGTAIINTTEGGATGIEEQGMSFDILQDTDGVMGEIQHLWNSGMVSLQSGAGYIDSEITDTFALSFPFPSETELESTITHANIYGYGHLSLPRDVTATLGLSGDLLDNEAEDREEINPKLGVTWQATDSTLVRGAAFKAVQRRFLNDQTIEPTQVAGFNQFFEDSESTLSWTYGIGLDQTFTSSLFGGVQFFHRDLDVPFTAVSLEGIPSQEEADWQEDIGSAYLYWAPVAWASLGVEYYYEQFDHEKFEGEAMIRTLTTHRIAPQVSFFHSLGFSATLRANYIDQEGEFGDHIFGFTPAEDQFWLVDLAFDYRLPKRYGIVSLGVKNLFNEEFNYVDTDAANPRFQPEQLVMLSLTVNL